MTELIGRFLSFEDQMGRGLVKVTYYVALFFLVVVTLFKLIAFLFGGEFGHFFLTPFIFLIQLLGLRLAAELVMAILSIDDNLRSTAAEVEGFEAGLTPSTTIHDSKRPSTMKTEPSKVPEEDADSTAETETPTSPTEDAEIEGEEDDPRPAS